MNLTSPSRRSAIETLGAARAQMTPVPLFRATAQGSVVCILSSRVLTVEAARRALPAFRETPDPFGVNAAIADALQEALAEAALVRARAS